MNGVKRANKRLISGKTLQDFEVTGLEIDVMMSLVCANLEKPVGKILEIIEEQLGIRLNRAQPYELLRRAAKEKRLTYVPPLDSHLANELLERYELRRARVVRSLSATDVARHAAILMREFAESWQQPDLHIGIAGGALIAETIRFWAEFLKQSRKLRFKRLFIHALVAATDDPRRSPNGFVQWLLEEALPFETKFISLPAPAFLSSASLENLRRMDEFQDAFKYSGDLSLIVSSAGAHWDRGCSGLHHKYKEVSSETALALEREGCIGDLMWQPFGPAGPLTSRVGKRAATLLDLEDIPQLVPKGMRVMLVIAPCGGEGCGKPKEEILRALLAWRNGITDVVVDASAAQLALRE